MRLVFAFSCKPTQRERFPDFNVFGALVGDPPAASHGRNESDEDEETPRRKCEMQRSQAGCEEKKKPDSITSLRKELADVKRENKHLNKIIKDEGARHRQEMFVALKLVDD